MPRRWKLVVLAVIVPCLSGCALLPQQAGGLQAGAVRSAIERSTLVPLDAVAPPAAGTEETLRATLSGRGADGTIVAFVFWDARSSGFPAGMPGSGSPQVQTQTLPGNLIALRRLNVMVLYRPTPSGRNLTAQLRQALSDARAG
jgi:hypothetical protein